MSTFTESARSTTGVTVYGCDQEEAAMFRAVGSRLGVAPTITAAAVSAENVDLARGNRGTPPATVTFLSGDVHNSYLAEVSDPARYGGRSRIVQAVCSPIRNPMPMGVRVMMSLFARSLVRPMRFLASRSSRVPDPAYPWRVTEGPWFDNNVALCRVEEDGLRLTWVSGEVVAGNHDHPRLREVHGVRLVAPWSPDRGPGFDKTEDGHRNPHPVA